MYKEQKKPDCSAEHCFTLARRAGRGARRTLGVPEWIINIRGGGTPSSGRADFRLEYIGGRRPTLDPTATDDDWTGPTP